MSSKVLGSKLHNLNGVAKKVLEVVPLQSYWTINQILVEMQRLGSRPDYRIVQGCLKALVEDGLVLSISGGSTSRGGYKRVAIGRSVESQEVTAVRGSVAVVGETRAAATAATIDNDKDPLKQIEQIAARLKALSTEISSLAGAIEDVGVEFSVRNDAAKAGNAKLAALQKLLKSIQEE